MSIAAGYAIHPINGSKEPIFEGWNWPAFFFGVFWCAAKGLWSLVAILVLLLLFMLALPVIGLLAAIGVWIYLGANGNELYQKNHIKQGYMIEDKSFKDNKIIARLTTLSSETKIDDAIDQDIINKLERLQRLREQGALTEDEFLNQKSKLII